MGIKACNAVEPEERKVNFGGEILQLVGGQVAELTLNLPQFVKDQRLASSTGEYSFATVKTTGSACECCVFDISGMGVEASLGAVILPPRAVNKSDRS